MGLAGVGQPLPRPKGGETRADLGGESWNGDGCENVPADGPAEISPMAARSIHWFHGAPDDEKSSLMSLADPRGRPVLRAAREPPKVTA